MKSLIGRRYAMAIFEIALEANVLEKFTTDFDTVRETILSYKDLRRALGSPIIKASTKKAIISSLFEKSVSPETLNVLLLMIDKGRAEYLGDMANEFFTLLDENKGIQNISITSAIPLSENELSAVCTKIESLLQSKIKATASVDPTLIGGLKIRVNDTVIDGSIKRKLEQLKDSFLKAPLN